MWEAANLIVDVVLVVGQGILHVSQSKMRAQAKKIEQLEDKIAKDARAQVEAFLEKETAALKTSIVMLTRQLELHNQRLNDGEGAFDALASSDHRLELKVTERFGEMRDWMHQTFAGKADLANHEKSVAGKFDSLTEAISSMARELAAATARRPR